VKNQFGGKIHRHVRRTVARTALQKNTPDDFARKPPAHRPKCETDAIPAKIAKATGGFQPAVHANVRVENFFSHVKTECGRDAFDLADVCLVVERFANVVEPRIVHEHDAVHELH